MDAEDEAPATEAIPISDDWLSAFENVAAPVSTEDMQERLSRILAGEIQQPGSFSVRTLKLVADLDKQVLALFKTLCSMTISMEIPSAPRHVLDARVVSLNGNAAANSLKPFGLGFGQLNTLQEYGLIIADYNSYVDYGQSIVRTEAGQRRVTLPLFFQKSPWGLAMKDKENPAPKELNLHGVAFSKAGQELMGVMDTEKIEPYTTGLISFFSDRGLELEAVKYRQK